MGGSNGGMMHLNCTQECCGRDASVGAEYMVVIVRMFYVIAIVRMVVL